MCHSVYTCSQSRHTLHIRIEQAGGILRISLPCIASQPVQWGYLELHQQNHWHSSEKTNVGIPGFGRGLGYSGGLLHLLQLSSGLELPFLIAHPILKHLCCSVL